MIRQSAKPLLLLVVLAALASAQSARQVPSPALSGPLGVVPASDLQGNSAELPYSEVLVPPAIVTRERLSLAFGSELGRSNYVTGSLHMVAAYDSNIAAVPGQSAGDFSYLFAPAIEFNKTAERWRWSFGYAPGFTVNQRFTERNQSNQNLNVDMSYRFSPHVALRIRDSFEKSNSLFPSILDNPGAAGVGPLEQPNQSVVTPLADRTGNTGSVDLSYQFSPSSMIGGGATQYFVNYGATASAPATSSGLVDTRSFAAGGFYAHRFTNRHWIGGSYNFQQLNFDPQSRTEVQRVLAFYSLPFRTNMTLSFWGGPEYSTTRSGGVASDPLSTASRTRWTSTGGLAYEWTAQHTSFRAEYSRRISDGGGLSDAVILQTVSAGIRHQMTARWTARCGAGYSNSDPLAGSAIAAGEIRTLSADAGLERMITDNLSLGFAYGHDHQTYGGTTPASQAADVNRAWVSFSYSFTRPLGR